MDQRQGKLLARATQRARKGLGRLWAQRATSDVQSIHESTCFVFIAHSPTLAASRLWTDGRMDGWMDGNTWQPRKQEGQFGVVSRREVSTLVVVDWRLGGAARAIQHSYCTYRTVLLGRYIEYIHVVAFKLSSVRVSERLGVAMYLCT